VKTEFYFPLILKTKASRYSTLVTYTRTIWSSQTAAPNDYWLLCNTFVYAAHFTTVCNRCFEWKSYMVPVSFVTELKDCSRLQAVTLNKWLTFQKQCKTVR